MTFAIQNVRIGSQPIASTDTTQNHPLGTIVTAEDPTYGSGEFIYLQGVASTAVGSWVLYNPDNFSTSLATANDKGSIAVAMSANVASSYGWYQIKGKAVGKALTGFVDNADPYLTSTAGSLDDAVVTGDYVHGAKGASAVGTPSSGLAEFEIDNPRTGIEGIEDAEARTFSGNVNLSANFSLGGTQVTATAAELNYNDLTTGPGTQEASKAVVADANVNTGVSKVTELHIGASGSEVQVNATPAEINRAADVSARLNSITTTPVTATEAANEGILNVLNKADGSTVTLPVATGSGGIYHFVVATSVTSNAYVIQVADSSTVMDGIVHTMDDSATPVPGGWVTAADSDTVTLDGSTQGGIIGDELIFTDIAANQWMVRGFLKQSGTEATPFSAAV